MAVTITKYTHAHKILVAAGDWGTTTAKLALLTSGYTFSAAHTAFDNGADDATDPSFNEVTTGDGYTTGGATLTCTISDTAIDANDVTWTALTKTFRQGVIYFDDTVEGVAKPLLFRVLFDDTPADITIPGIDFVVVWNASGIATL